MYRRSDLIPLKNFLREKKYDFPVDLAIPKHFDRNGRFVHERMPNLFQHMGYVSTFDGNGKEREDMKSSTFQRNEVNTTHYAYEIDETSGYIGCFRDSIEGMCVCMYVCMYVCR